ncbi:hypothetical protein AQUCO_11200008v1 [Aquilegia coerulea]|uniref:Uncharacterized protein n=1 Tax=Aquilegia coerulea TaxID=218851 RepID=A0A2G5C2H5_AQUCA|nr:hypothetical protein AQUCO_11200008v1 [Aquilegia coerulea]
MIEEHDYEYGGTLLPSQLEHMETLWYWLNDKRVGTIRIQGDTGMGKTWMARQLKDRAIISNLFDIVIWIDATHKTLLDAQEHIVDQLGLSVKRETDEGGRYVKEDLMQKVALSLGKQRYLLVINDFRYSKIGHDDFGFGDPRQQNYLSKILMSGPDKFIAHLNTHKICKVNPLTKDEAWLLFLRITRLDTDDSPNVREIAQCLLMSFKGNTSKIVSGGRYAANLTSSVCDLLNSGRKDVIDCFQYCTYLSTKDRFRVKDLIPYWIVEILLDHYCCIALDEAYEKVHHILKELNDRQILECDGTHVWVKTLLPDLNSIITLPSSHHFDPIKPWRYDTDISCVMNENLQIQDSADAREYSSATQFLLLYGKEGCLPRKIPDLFFTEMQQLLTLAIVDAGIISLPESISKLKRLDILVLRGCRSLKNVNQIKGLQKLRYLRLSGASSLKEIPDDIFRHLVNLKVIDLSNNKLTQLPSSVANLPYIQTLILRGCSRLETIPRIISAINLDVLDLSGASALRSIPDRAYYLKLLNLSGTLVECLPSPSSLDTLEHLLLRGCTKITTMPHPDEYKSLHVLDLSAATSFREFQGQKITSADNYGLKKLDLSGSLIAQMPPFVGFFSISQILLRNCCHIKTMPPLNVKVEVLDLSGSTAFKSLQDEPLLDQLRELDLSRTQIGKLPVLSIHSVMVQLILRGCEYLVELPQLELQRLQVLDLSGSTKFKKFKDDSFNKLRKLKTLNLSETQVAKVPTFSECSELRQLILRNCLKLETLPHLITLEKLELLDLSGAISFKEFQDVSFGKKEDLQELNLSETQVVQIPSLSECHNLCKLNLGNCSKLKILPSLDAFSRLVVLDLSRTISLMKLQYASIGMKYDHLQMLDLSQTQVPDVSFLSGCVNIRQLFLRDCVNIQTVPPLHGLTRLEVLDLSGTKTKDFSVLSGFKSLRQLLLRDCLNLQTLIPLEQHKGLEVLDLSGTKIEDFSLLSGFNKLSQLSLRGCFNLEMLSCEGMHNLQKVDLSESSIAMLPSSFSGLRNISSLLLKDCSSLETLPQMEMLTKLEVLDLSCTKLREFPNGISERTHVRFLKVQEENHLFEFQNVKSFERFHFCLFAPNERIREKDIYLQDRRYSFRYIYYQTSHIPQLTEEPDKFFKFCGFKTFPVGIEEVLTHVELLYLKNNSFITRMSDLGAENMKEMRECWIENCDSMEIAFYGGKQEENVALGRCLQNLWVSKLFHLKSLFGGEVESGSFTLLKHLYIECCPSLITVFSSHLELKSLEVLKIKFCDNIENMFGEMVLGEKSLPKLLTLILVKLPELQSICRGVLPSLKNLRVIGCSKIKKLPVSGKRTSPRVKVKGEIAWWNDLEWEDEATKSHLLFSLF